MTEQEKIVAAAQAWIGTPYRHQASLKSVGCDCLGLIRGVWRDIYGEEPEETPAYSPDWAEGSGDETLAEAARRHFIEVSCKDMRAGDVVLFRWKKHLPAKHAAILVADNAMVHAQDGQRVSEVALTDWWLKRVAYVFRFPTAEAA